MKIGYARISTTQQCLENQVIRLKAAGCEQIYQEVGSGAKWDRAILLDCLKYIRPGETLVVTDLDRLGRTKWELLELIKNLKEKGINFRCLNQDLDFSTSMGEMMLFMFAQLAEMERNIFNERRTQGMERARARGKVGGRKKILDEKQAEVLRQLYNSKKFSRKEIAHQLKIGESTIYKYLNAKEDVA
jgi:DNA invertase Pin-like site-specific DNA recombinase